MKDFNRADRELRERIDRSLAAKQRAGEIRITSGTGRTSDGSVGDIERRLHELRELRQNNDPELQAILNRCELLDRNGNISNEDWNTIVQGMSDVRVQQDPGEQSPSVTLPSHRVSAPGIKTNAKAANISSTFMLSASGKTVCSSQKESRDQIENADNPDYIRVQRVNKNGAKERIYVSIKDEATTEELQKALSSYTGGVPRQQQELARYQNISNEFVKRMKPSKSDNKNDDGDKNERCTIM